MISRSLYLPSHFIHVFMYIYIDSNLCHLFTMTASPSVNSWSCSQILWPRQSSCYGCFIPTKPLSRVRRNSPHKHSFTNLIFAWPQWAKAKIVSTPLETEDLVFSLKWVSNATPSQPANQPKVVLFPLFHEPQRHLFPPNDLWIV